MNTTFDPIKLEVFSNLFHSVAEEMGVTLCRTSFSPNIKERRDYSCAVFDGEGRMVAQGDHMPVHLGSMPLSVLSAIENVKMNEGDVVVLNDAYKGGTHLPDVTMVSPVFHNNSRKPVFFVANRAHHADIGGMTPGSMPIATEIFQEGVIIPPIRLIEAGKLNRAVMDLILSNVRTPNERDGDFTAQLAANKTGERRLIGIVEKYGTREIKKYMKELQDYAERMTRSAIEAMPNGEYIFSDFMDDDGISRDPVEIKVKISIKDDEAIVDFTGSSDQVKGSINAVYAITLSVVIYVFRCIVGRDIPSNHGISVPIKVIAPQGSILNANFPAPVVGGNVETSQRITDVLLGALAKAVPHLIPAASSGSMNNLAVGGIELGTEKSFAYYETVGGGMGARPTKAGIDGIHTHMTNTMNTPIEALENSYPFKVTRYEIRRSTGGKGNHRGGDGIIREIEFLCDSHVTMLSERRKFEPYGIQGGQPGTVGENVLVTKSGEKSLNSKFNILVEKGDILSIRTPGGGGYGNVDK